MISFSTAFLSSATLLFCSGVLIIRVAAASPPLANGVLTQGGLPVQTHRHLAVGSGSRNMRALFGPGDACQLSALPIPNSNSPTFFKYYEESDKDFSSYFTATNEVDFDYTALQQIYKTPCEFFGGILYSISGFQACGNADHEDFGTNYADKNLPYCAYRYEDCTIDESTVYNSEHFNFCEDQEQATREYQVSTVDTSVMSGECKAQLDMFSPAVHYLTALQDVDLTKYISEDESEYDLEPTLANFTVACEAEGGYLYKFSQKMFGNEFSDLYYGGVGVAYMNQPVCLGTSCDATKFFEELLIPTFNFMYDGNFRTTVAPGNETYPAEQKHTFLGFEQVSDVPTPSSSSALSLVSIFAASLSVFVSMAIM